MKNIILLVVLLSVAAYSQAWKSAPVQSTGHKINTASNNGAWEGRDSGAAIAELVYVVNPNGVGFNISGSGFATGNFNYSALTDTLSGVSDTVTFNFGNQFKTCAVVIRDTVGGGGTGSLIDSVKIETYNSTLAVWTTKVTGFYDAGSGDIYFGDALVPGNGVTKKYYLNCLYPSQVRITWHKSVADALNPSFPKAGRIVPIAFEGSN